MLTEAAAGDEALLQRLVARREGGEPVEWIVGWAPFCGLRVRVAVGVFVPRSQTEPLARRAAELLADDGVAVDLATGCGAIALVMARARPTATIVTTELDPVAAACARSNGVDVRVGDLDAVLPPELAGRVDVLTANVPYVPTPALRLLPRDVVRFEPRLALDGGLDGFDQVRRVFDVAASTWLRDDGCVLVEIGPAQVDRAERAAAAAGLVVLEWLRDADGVVRGAVARRP